MRLKYIYLSLLFAIACSKDEEPQAISATPQILSVDLSPTHIKVFQDSLTFKIRYQDGDGDLGSSKRDEENLFIQDDRLPSDKVHRFRIAQLSPENVPIQGNLNVVLRNILLTDSLSSQDVSFSVWMKDRSGKESNRFQTGKITITR